MARTKPLEQDEPLTFSRGVLDTLIAKHDPEAIREQGKDPAAVLRGMKGGAKGGPARAKALSASKRKSISQKAVRTRWKKKQ